jgi:hypothetical protein
VSDKDEGRAFSGLCQCVVKFEIELRKAAGLRTGIAPCISGAVVGADAGELLDALLDEDPIERKIAESVFDDDGERAFAGAVEMEAMPAEID